MTIRELFTRATLPLIAVLTLTTCSQLHAQIFMDGGGEDMQEQMQKQLLKSIELQKTAAENRIQSRIADMDRACQLTDKQKQKLAIATKGAVKAHLNQAKKNMVEYAKQMGIEFDPDAEPEEKEADENNEEENMQAMMAQEIFLGSMFDNGTNSNDVENGKVWQSAVKKVLDEEQTQKWEAWLAQRHLFQRRVAVEQFIARADRKLLLSPEQRDELTKYLDEKHGEQLQQQAAANDANQFGMNVFFGGAMMGGDVQQAEADEALKKILSESQLMEWQRNFEPQLSGMAGGGFGGFNAIGGALAMPALEVGGEIEEEEDDN